MHGVDDHQFIPYTSGYGKYHKEHQRQHGQDILDETGSEDALMESQYSEHDLLIVQELKKEKTYQPQNPRYFLRRRQAKAQRKAEEKTRKTNKYW